MGYRLKIRDVGQRVKSAGYVTTLRHVLVGGSTPSRIEHKMGFTPGSLVEGYWLLRLAPQAVIGPQDFEFRGYTHLEDGKPKGSADNVHDLMQARYARLALDQQQKARMLLEGAARLMAKGLDRVCKVYPVRHNGMGYKVGDGVPQYLLTKEQPFDVIARVETGECLRALAPGVVETIKA